MSGHSKWATTKHKKAANDAKRGKLFAKLIKNIEVAARVGGGDIMGNPTLFDAVQKAKKSSVPADNIDRAVKRGSGAESGGADWTTIFYEAYGPAGVAILIECLTDNRNRSASDVRIAVTRHGGRMADVGSVQRLFTRKGIVTVAKKQESGTISDLELMEATLEADPESIEEAGDNYEIICESTQLVEVRTAIQDAGYDYESADISFQPTFTSTLSDVDDARKLYRILDALDDCDDVQNVYTNEVVAPEIEPLLENE